MPVAIPGRMLRIRLEMSPLRWTCKNMSQLTRALVAKSHGAGRTLVRDLLRRQKFSPKANRKTREGYSHPDRNAQFNHLNESVRAALAAGKPVISVDTKKIRNSSSSRRIVLLTAG